MQLNRNHIAIILIILVAAFLRFFRFAELPFTHDEFSTLFRLNFDNFSDLITYGVMPDGHPAGLHVFCYYFTKFFGIDETTLKLPVVLFGIFSVLIIYVIGKKWFNKTAGLYSASLFAVLQHTVVQSQVVRMYGFGILFTLTMVYFWHKLVYEKFTLKAAMGFIISGIICSYNHYFSLLFTAIVGFTGIILIAKYYKIKYLIICIVIALAFIPHLTIFFNQLALGGIEGWLGKVSPTYFFEYLAIVFNQSWIVGIVVLIVPILFFTKNKAAVKFRHLSLAWFILPFIIAFTYSLFVSNLLHERVLYFSFPFLLFFIASFIKEQPFKKELFMVALVLLVGVSSLFIERDHYNIFINHRYKIISNSYNEWQSEINGKECLNFRYTYDKVDDYYTKGKIINLADSVKSKKQIIELLKKSHAPYLYFGHRGMTNTTELQIVKDYYPKIVKNKYTAAGEVYLFMKDSLLENNHCIYKTIVKNFTITDLIDTVNNCGNEYIGPVEAKLSDVVFSDNNIIELSCEFMSKDSLKGAQLVSSIEYKGEVLDWRSITLNEYELNDTLLNKAYYSIPLPDIKFHKDATIKLLIWNPNKAKYEMPYFKVEVRAGNPITYGHIEKIPWNKSKYCM